MPLAARPDAALSVRPRAATEKGGWGLRDGRHALRPSQQRASAAAAAPDVSIASLWLEALCLAPRLRSMHQSLTSRFDRSAQVGELERRYPHAPGAVLKAIGGMEAQP
jgi:hypothetical protein